MINNTQIATSIIMSNFDIKDILAKIEKLNQMPKPEYDCIGCSPSKWEELKNDIIIKDYYYYGMLNGLPVYVLEEKRMFLELLIEFNQKGLWIE